MRRARPFRPAVNERLEDRLILSAVSASMPPYVSSHAQQPNLVGLLQGTTFTPGGLPDTGSTTYFNGSGTVGPLGNVRAGGFLQHRGFLLVTPEIGFLGLTNSRGSVILEFSRMVNSSGVAIGPYQFQIVTGSGAYRGTHGSGTLTIAYGGPIGVVPGPIGTIPGQTGSFVMAINEPMPPIALPL